MITDASTVTNHDDSSSDSTCKFNALRNVEGATAALGMVGDVLPPGATFMAPGQAGGYASHQPGPVVNREAAA